MRLFLFDVDGTLLSARGAGRRALSRALETSLPAAFLADAASGAITTNTIEGGARGQE